MDYLDYRREFLAHSSSYSEAEKAGRKSQIKPINRDFLDDLPVQVRNIMDEICWTYRDQPWFEEAWNKYRKHVLDAGLGGKIRMPGFVFNEYIDRYVDEQEKKMKKDLAHMDTCYIGELYHHGIKGQKWGVRRFQNEDGSLTNAGEKRYLDGDKKPTNRLLRAAAKNRSDAAQIRNAAKNAKTEKARKDLLDSADALDQLASKQESKGQKSGVRRYQNEDGTLTDEGRKKLERIGTLHGYTSGVEKSIYESARAGKQLLFTKDQVDRYQSYKKELDGIINKLDKENIHVLQKRYSNKGEEFVSVAFDSGKDIDDVDKRSVYSVRLYR